MLEIDFTPPALTDDNAKIKRLSAIDLRAGEDDPRWDSTSKAIEAPAAGARSGARESAGRGLGGQRHRAAGSFGGQSRPVLRVVERGAPQGRFRRSIHRRSKWKPSPDGVRIAWTPQAGAAAEYRVYKQGPGETKPSLIASVKTAEYVDARAEYGKTVRVFGAGIRQERRCTEAQSEPSETVSITPVDKFPPAVPSGLTATAGINSIELSWDPDHETRT